MKRWARWGVVLGALLSVAVVPGHAAAPAGPPQVKTVALLIRHRVFPSFRDEQTVAIKQEFRVGDTQYSARVIQFVPDFAMDLEKHKVISRSQEPKNPAFRIIVREKGTPQDTVWAFLNMPPHFARKSLLAFQVLRVEFLNHPPIATTDTTLTRKS